MRTWKPAKQLLGSVQRKAARGEHSASSIAMTKSSAGAGLQFPDAGWSGACSPHQAAPASPRQAAPASPRQAAPANRRQASPSSPRAASRSRSSGCAASSAALRSLRGKWQEKRLCRALQNSAGARPPEPRRRLGNAAASCCGVSRQVLGRLAAHSTALHAPQEGIDCIQVSANAAQRRGARLECGKLALKLHARAGVEVAQLLAGGLELAQPVLVRCVSVCIEHCSGVCRC